MDWIEWVKRVAAAPVFDGDGEKTRQAHLLNVILWTLLAIFGLTSVPLIHFNDSRSNVIFSAVLLGVFLLTIILLLLLLHAHRVRLTAVLLCLVCWLALTVTAVRFGGLRTSAVAGYVVVIVVAGLVLGGRGVLVFGSLCMVAALGVFYAYRYRPALLQDLLSTRTHTDYDDLFMFLAIAGVAAVIVALTLRVLTDALKHLQEKARLAQAKRHFLALSAHELRTPLSTIVNYAEFLREAVVPESLKKEMLERVGAVGQEMAITVSNIAYLTQDQAGELRYTSGTFRLASLLDDVRYLADALTAAKGLEWVTEVSPDVPEEVEGDRFWAQEILANLISNAVKFTDEGTVVIRIYSPDPRRWAMEVSDSGRGIPDDALEWIYDPFMIADDPDTRDRRGAGLGLAVVKAMVQRMQGEVSVRSKVGQGSTFTVVLPVRVR